MQAVVFDFDGVIIRSMELHAEAYRQTLAPAGVHVTEAEIFQMEGRRTESLIEHFLQRAGRPADSATVARLSKEKQALFTRLGPPALYEGAEDMVRRVRAAAKKTAIVTGTRRENLDRLVPTLIPLFDKILAQDSYVKDKPDPEPYANAARALDVAPADCIAIENAPNGVRSACAAGYAYVVAITTTVSARQLADSGAHLIVHDHGSAANALLAALQR